MKPIYLIGFMGVGKTSLGRKLAHQLSIPFIDLDHAIEEEAKHTVSELFEMHGEEGFRKIESELLKKVSIENCVIACGGGTPCFNDNLDFMFETGILVYLKMDTGMLVHRLQVNRAKRPLIASLTEEELYKFVYEKLAERESFYINAHFIFYPHRQKLDTLIEQLNNFKTKH